MFYKPGGMSKIFTRIVCNVFETFKGFHRPFFFPLAKTVAMSRIEVGFRLVIVTSLGLMTDVPQEAQFLVKI